MDDEDIHDRLERLEATVADQQQTIEQLTDTPAVGRRSVVASLLGAGAVGGLAGYGSQRSRAQASGPAGQVGTGEEPVDGFLWDLDVQNGAEFNGNPLTGVGPLDAEDARVENSSCMIGLGSDQTIQNDTFTIVEFSDASGDRHNQIGFDTTNNKYVASDEQTVSIFANLCWNNQVTGQIRLQFLKNGNAIPGGRIVENGTDGPAESILSYRNVKLQENDELEVQTRQRHGDVRDLRSGTIDNETYVAIRRL